MRSTTLTHATIATFLCLVAPAQASDMAAVPYTCEDGRSLSVTFSEGQADITMTMSVEAQPSGSGFLYEGISGALSGQGDELMWQSATQDAVSCTAVPGGKALVGGTWQLDRVDDVSAEELARHTLSFLADGSLLIRADCNRGRGNWEAAPAEATMTLGPAALTRAACPADPFPQMAADLSGQLGYTAEAGSLRLDTPSGAVYVFVEQSQ